MNWKHKAVSCGMAAALALSLSVPALAAAPDFTGERGGETIISVFETDVDPANISFEVPLYLTLGVVKGDTNVLAPNNYEIKNTSDAANVKDGIAVTGMYFDKMDTATWTLTTSSNPNTAAREMNLKLGGLTMPNVTDAGKPVAVDVKTAGSAFYAGNKYTKIASGDGTLSIPVVGKVSATAPIDATKGAAAQFRVIYIVSPLDENGNPVALTGYAGDIYGPAPGGAQLPNAENPKYFGDDNNPLP